ncbi:transcription factor bHLH167-like [Cucurbita pepo subsp. pepo]|uniref:transcription factor bHLH167-like n=1 Tax=Cucurbita pepo subsp. pepo TaxID=3664 RepID=UPI000C9D9B92|nr:transcription factor bHLH167-like [Cucurbita pepo subsp. pepo]
MADNFIYCPSSTRTDEKIIERNRREEMKALLSELHSLVPNQSSTEGEMTLSDQLENATNYIKQLKENVEKLKEKREKLMGLGEKSTITSENKARLILQVEAHRVGSSLEILLTTGSVYHLVLRQIIQLLQENGTEIVDINQSTVADRAFHKIIAQVKGAEGERICETVKKFVSQYKDDQYTV